MSIREIVQKHIAAGLITVAPPMPPSYTVRGKYKRTPEILTAVREAQVRAWTPERRAAQSALARAKHAERKQRAQQQLTKKISHE